MPAQITDFPDISSIIYSEKHSIDGIRSRYIEELRNTGCIYNKLYANKLEESSEMLHPAKLKELEKEFYDFKEHMRDWCKKNHITLSIKYRQKDFIRYNDKIRRKLIINESLDRVFDLLGFRIIIGSPSNDTQETVRLCYKVLHEVIDFFVTKKHAIPLAAEQKVDTDFNQSEHPNVIIPNQNYIMEGFEDTVKDYVMYPKKAGYQSLHIVIRKPNGLTFEVQIRTFAMDVHAEGGPASHHNYYVTERKKESDISLDYSKINLPGFTYLSNGQIYDTIGLVKSIDPFNHF